MRVTQACLCYCSLIATVVFRTFGLESREVGKTYCDEMNLMSADGHRKMKVAVNSFSRKKAKHLNVDKRRYDRGPAHVLLVGSSNFRNIVNVFATLMQRQPHNWLEPLGPFNVSRQLLVRSKKGTVLANFMGLDFSEPHYKFAYPIPPSQRSHPNERMIHDAIHFCDHLGGHGGCDAVDIVVIDMIVWQLSSLFQRFCTRKGWDVVVDKERILAYTPGEGWYHPKLATEFGTNLTALVKTAIQTFPRAKVCVQVSG